MKAKICLSVILCICAQISFSDGLKTIRETLMVLRPDYFFSEDYLHDLGTVRQENGDELRILFNEHFWGNGRCSSRIVIIKNKTPIGAYGGIGDRPTVNCRGLEFPYQSNRGNIVFLEKEIPETVYLDGEYYRFEYF